MAYILELLDVCHLLVTDAPNIATDPAKSEKKGHNYNGIVPCLFIYKQLPERFKKNVLPLALSQQFSAKSTYLQVFNATKLQRSFYNVPQDKRGKRDQNDIFPRVTKLGVLDKPIVFFRLIVVVCLGAHNSRFSPDNSRLLVEAQPVVRRHSTICVSPGK